MLSPVKKGGVEKMDSLMSPGSQLKLHMASGAVGTNMISMIVGQKNGAFAQITKMFQVVGKIKNLSSQFNLKSLAKYIRA
jgi:hypothetical protein